MGGTAARLSAGIRARTSTTKQSGENLEAAKREMNPPDAPSPETGED